MISDLVGADAITGISYTWETSQDDFKILIHLMVSILCGIKTREALFYHCLSALRVKPLTCSNYSTSTFLTPKCLYLLLDSWNMFLENPDFWFTSFAWRGDMMTWTFRLLIKSSHQVCSSTHLMQIVWHCPSPHHSSSKLNFRVKLVNWNDNHTIHGWKETTEVCQTSGFNGDAQCMVTWIIMVSYWNSAKRVLEF